MAKQGRDSLNIGVTLAEQVHGKAVAGAVPCDVLFNSCTGNPYPQGFQASGVARQCEDGAVFLRAFADQL